MIKFKDKYAILSGKDAVLMKKACKMTGKTPEKVLEEAIMLVLDGNIKRKK